MRAEKTEPEKQNQSSEALSAVASQPAEQPPRATEPRRSRRTIRCSPADRSAAGFAARPVDTNVPGYDWTAAFSGMRQLVGRQAEGTRSASRSACPFSTVGTTLARAGPVSKTASADGKRHRRSGKVPPFTMLPPETQAVEDDVVRRISEPLQPVVGRGAQRGRLSSSGSLAILAVCAYRRRPGSLHVDRRLAYCSAVADPGKRKQPATGSFL